MAKEQGQEKIVRVWKASFHAVGNISNTEQVDPDFQKLPGLDLQSREDLAAGGFFFELRGKTAWNEFVKCEYRINFVRPKEEVSEFFAEIESLTNVNPLKKFYLLARPVATRVLKTAQPEQCHYHIDFSIKASDGQSELQNFKPADQALALIECLDKLNRDGKWDLTSYIIVKDEKPTKDENSEKAVKSIRIESKDGKTFEIEDTPLGQAASFDREVIGQIENVLPNIMKVA